MRWLASWLQILRISGAVTLLGNALAAWAFVIYVDGSDPLLLAEKLYRTSDDALWVLVTSLLLYVNGMLWNAVLDLDRDRELHPTRPLITGRVSPGTALVVGFLLSVGSLLAGLQLGFRGFLGAGVVLMLSFCYNAAAKHLPFVGSICMGLVRAAHAVFVLLALGPDLFDRMLITSVAWLVPVDGIGLVGLPPVYPLLLFSYVCGLTLVSELESRFGRRFDLLVATVFLVAPVPVLLLRIFGTPWLVGLLEAQSFLLGFLGMLWVLILLGLWLMRFMPRLLRLLQGLEQRKVPGLTRRLLGSMLFFDALCASIAHPLYGLVVLLLIPAFGLLRLAGRME